MNICFLDTETSAKSPRSGRGRIVEIAYEIRAPWPTMTLIASVEQKIRLLDYDRRRAEPQALLINRYNDEEWADAPLASKELWQQIIEPLKDVVLCGQNVSFDRDWILHEMGLFGLIGEDDEPPWNRRFVDIQGYSHAIAETLDLPDFGLHTVYDATHGPLLPRHRAMPDVLRTRWIYMLARSSMADGLALTHRSERQLARGERQPTYCGWMDGITRRTAADGQIHWCACSLPVGHAEKHNLLGLSAKAPASG